MSPTHPASSSAPAPLHPVHPPLALVLDYGGVICQTFFERHPQNERRMGLPPGSLTWRGPFDPDHDPLWRDMIADRITEREYWRLRAVETGRLLGETWTDTQQMMRRAHGDDPAAYTRPEALQTVHAVRDAGLKVGVLSNELDLFNGPAFRQQLPVLQLMDQIVDATYTRILKPDPRAYALAAEALGVPINRCLMVDDQPRNIAGAEAAGMHTVWFDVTRPAESYRRVRQLMGVEQRTPLATPAA